MTQNDTSPIYSSYANDEMYAGLIQEFVSSMPNKMQTIDQRLKAKEFDALKDYFHQIKGAAGSYGFESMSIMAAKVEDFLKLNLNEIENSFGAVENLVQEFKNLCARIQP